MTTGGKVCFEGLPTGGTYTVTETQAPTGYQIDDQLPDLGNQDAQLVTVSSSGTCSSGATKAPVKFTDSPLSAFKVTFLPPAAGVTLSQIDCTGTSGDEDGGANTSPTPTKDDTEEPTQVSPQAATPARSTSTRRRMPTSERVPRVRARTTGLRLITGAVCVAVVLAAGCGDNNDALSYDETGEELSAICEKYDTASDRRAHRQGRAGRARDRGYQREDRAGSRGDPRLEVNEELEEARDDFVTVVEGSLARGQELQELAEAGDQRGYLRKIRELQRTNSELGAEAEAAASKLGAPACAQNT